MGEISDHTMQRIAGLVRPRFLVSPVRSSPACLRHASPARRYCSEPGQSFDLFNPTPEHAALREMVRQFTENEVDPQALEHDAAEKFNIDLFRQLGELGLHGITVSPEYGGSGMDAAAAVIVHEELSAADPGFCLAYLAHSMLFTNNLYHNGNDEQKQRFLPRACEGSIIGGMGMSEPGAGTDVLGLSTKAVQNSNGDYVLNGSKMWITNGAINDTELGDVFLIYTRTGEARNDITMFIVEKGMPGFKLGQRIKDKCGMRASGTAELVFDDCVVPPENMVGDKGGALICMMRNLEIERLVLAAMSLGIAKRCCNVMVNYAKERKSFGKPINAYGQIQRHIADSYADYRAGAAYTYMTANNMRDLSNAGNRIDSDGVKLFCSVMSTAVANRAMQVLGGYGYVGEYQVERLWRDSKLLEIGGGTLEAHQKNMSIDLSKTDDLEQVGL